MESKITRILIFVLILPLITASTTISQPPNTLWTRTYGGISTDVFTCVELTTDNGYILAGSIHSYGAGAGDVWLVKTNTDGDSLWTRTFGGSGADGAWDIEQTHDGGYIIVGQTASQGAGGNDFWIIKTNALGNEQWNHTIGGINDDTGHSVLQIADGGYLIAGNTESFYPGGSDIWLIKTDSLCNEEWNQVHGGQDDDYCNGVQQTSDGGYIVIGSTSSYGAGSSDVWMIKTDSVGNEQWTRTFGGYGQDGGLDIQRTTDNGYIITGFTTSLGVGSADVWIVKTDSFGFEEWNHTFGGVEWDHGKSVRQTSDGGYIVVGETSSYGSGQEDIWVIKTDSLGNDLWIGMYGGSARDVGMCVRQTGDDGYIIAAHTASFGAGDADGYLIRLDRESPVSIDPTVHHPSEFVLHPPYPNPFNPTTTINYDVPISGLVRLNIYNLLGQRVATIADHYTDPGSYSTIWNAKDFPSGIYFCQLKAGNYIQTKKLLLLK